MDQNKLYDTQTVEIMKRVLSEADSAIDIGCHQGSMLTEMLKIAPKGRHHAFEPLPNLFASLRQEFSWNTNISLHELALSDATGVVTFQHVVSNPGYSGLRQRRYDRENEKISEIHVQTARLDDVIANDIDIRFVKIDVEGVELQVLLGGRELIRRCKPVIVFEHGLGAADYYGTTPENVFDLLVEDCGLRCFTMEQWLASNGGNSLERAEFCDEFRSGRNFYFLAAK